MNIFILDKDPAISASYYIDSHCVKIILEATQLLATTRNLLGLSSPYKSTHKNHPWRLFCGASLEGYFLVVEHGLALCSEYNHRYNKIHACYKHLAFFADDIPITLQLKSPLSTPLCMPDDCKTTDVVESYRNYYRNVKLNTVKCNWTNRERPSWL